MLNVPESVKALFKQDGIRKNFRVHFPGGELPDITNDNVVHESVRFTESLCSQDVLKFGLTEASVLEFETVGVGNMYGMTIEAGIEIDLSSLSAAELAEIEAGSWDGVYVPESDTDLGFPFFRVPYGVFRVESCPRDHQAMAHRRVQAYGKMNEMLKLSPLEEQKLALYASNNESFTGDLRNALFGNIAYYNPDILTEQGYTKTPVSATAWNSSSQVRIGTTTLEILESTRTYSGDSLFSLETGDYDPRYEEAIEWLDANYPIGSQRVTYKGEVIECSNYSELFDAIPYPLKNAAWWELRGADTGSRIIPKNLLTGQIVWAYRGENRVYINLHNVTAIRLKDAQGAIINTWVAENDVDVYRHETTAVAIPITFESTLRTTTASGATYYAYFNSYSLIDLMNGYLELSANFGRVNRLGTFGKLMLSDANPVAVNPQDYDRFWWDEYDVLPIGTIKYTLSVENADGENEYQFGDGLSVYDMTDNDMLKRMPEATTDSVEAILDEQFIPNLGPIAFTPIDLSMKGLPYLEAGDYLAVTAEDGMIANSFAMRQTISGIQVLTAEIESTSGEIISSEEAGT